MTLFIWLLYFLLFGFQSATLYLIVNIYTIAGNKSSNNAFNKKMANNLTKAPIYSC